MRKAVRQSQRYKLGGRHGHRKSMGSRHRPDVSVDYLRVPVEQVTLLLRRDCLPPSEDLSESPRNDSESKRSLMPSLVT